MSDTTRIAVLLFAAIWIAFLVYIDRQPKGKK